MFLAVPLFVVTNLLALRIEASSAKIEDEIAELKIDTNAKFDQLAASFDTRSTVLGWGAGGVRDDESTPLEQIGKLLDAGAAAQAGLIIALLPKHSIYVEFSRADDQIAATAIDASEVYGNAASPSLKRFNPVVVDSSDTLNHCAARVFEELRSSGEDAAHDAFNPADFEMDVVSTIADVARFYRHYIDDEPGGLRAVVNDEWIISNEALLARSVHYCASFTDLAGGYGWRPHLLEKNWVDSHRLNEAIRWAYSLGLAKAVWAEGSVEYSAEVWHPSSRLT